MLVTAYSVARSLLLFRVFATKLFAPCFSRLARALDPMLPVNQALHSIETGVERLAKLVEKKVRKKTDNLLLVPFSILTTPPWHDRTFF